MLDPQSTHWQFAAGNAFAALETQVRQFNFARYANSHTYSGLNPQEYIDIIDGFLAEDENVVPGGNRTSLQELRELLVHHILAAYDAGVHSAVATWTSSTTAERSMPNCDLHALACRLSPFSELKAEWFIEGFCYSYAQTEFESVRDAT